MVNTSKFSQKLLLFFAMAIGFAGALGAQGFYRTGPLWYSSDIRIQSVFALPDGFRIAANERASTSSGYLTFDQTGNLTATSPLQTLDDAYFTWRLANGDYYTSKSSAAGFRLSRFHANGDLDWETVQAFPNQEPTTGNVLLSLTANDAGEAYVRYGSYNFSTLFYQGHVVKFAPGGTQIWDATFSDSPDPGGNYRAQKFNPGPDGGGILVLWDTITTPTAGTYVQRILRLDGNGNTLWNILVPAGSQGLYPDINDKNYMATADGGAFIAHYVLDNVYTKVRVAKLNSTGAPVWENQLSLGPNLLHSADVTLVPTNDGGVAWFLGGRYSPGIFEIYAGRFDAGGNLLWQRRLGSSDNHTTLVNDAQQLADGGFVMVAININQAQTWQTPNYVLARTDANGWIFKNVLDGALLKDSIANCVLDPAESPLFGWIVGARQDSTGLFSFAVTDSTGAYAFENMAPGAYTVFPVVPNYLWQPCFDSLTLNFQQADTLQIETRDFPIETLADCPLMRVNLAAPFLRRCFPGYYAVHWTNDGTTDASPATVKIRLDPNLSFDSASIAHTLAGDTLIFDLGTAAPGDGGTFFVHFTVGCDSVALGQTLCSSAHIFPDSLCLPQSNWSGAAIRVSGWCEGDSVRFDIRNVGSGAMQEALDFIVVDDHVVGKQGMYELPPGGVRTARVPANGQIWRIFAEQEPGFPFGSQQPTVAVMGCGSTNFPQFAWFNQFPNYSGIPFEDIDCQEVRGSFDPNDKLAFPVGQGPEHLIEASTDAPIEYRIRFQNTGTDTAFTVAVRDTLSAFLDPATVRMGAASHLFEWRIEPGQVLVVRFPNILLPDSNVNEAASHGFFEFSIRQKPALPDGSVIRNQAAIYFDFNAPIFTPEVWHTIGKPQVPLAIWPGPWKDNAALALLFSPNPTSDATRLSFSENDFVPPAGASLRLMDVLGRLVFEKNCNGPNLELRQGDLPSGLYFAEVLDAAGRRLGTGKLVFGQ